MCFFGNMPCNEVEFKSKSIFIPNLQNSSINTFEKVILRNLERLDNQRFF